MSTSRISNTERVIRIVNTSVQVGAGQVRIPMTRDSLLDEISLNIAVSQAFTGVPTASDVRKVIKTISVETSDGRRHFASGFGIVDLGRITEATYAPKVVLAATSTANFAIDVHFSNAGAILDLYAALPAYKLTQLDLVIDFTDGVTDPFFTGGTVPLTPTFTAVCESNDYPAMMGFEGEGRFKHYVEKQEQLVTVTGTQAPIRLSIGNATRFIMLHAFAVTAGVATPSDAIITNVRLTIAGKQRRITTWQNIQGDNQSERGLAVVGLAVLDWGDYESGFLDLHSVNEALLEYDVVALVGTSAKVTMHHDYTKTGELTRGEGRN
jgi:hypothetical protein